MPYVIQPARDVLYAAYNPIYALASYPVLSREWLNQQTKSETQLRRENTAMQAELLQAQVRLQKLSELSAENTRLRGLLDTPLIIDGRMEIAEVIGTDADPLRHIIIINRGAMDHLKVGQTVLDDKGIMGQIINVYPHSSRVMLLSDKEHSLSVRLERTGFFKTVDIKPVRIPGSPDQIDLNVAVEEQHSGTSTLAVGFSQSGGVTFQAGLSQTNFLGTGNAVSIDLSRSQTQDYYNLSVTDPYFTIDGVRRGYNMYYRKTKLDEDYNVNNYVTDSLGGGINFGYPIDENQSISAGLNIDQTEVTTGPYVSTYVRDYLLAHGGKTKSTSTYCMVDLVPDSEGVYVCPDGQTSAPYGSEFTGDFLTYNLNLGWSYNTLNRPVFPTSGMSHRVNGEIALPGSDVEYQKLTYDAQAYFPLGKDFVLRGYGKLGYGNDLPFYKNFYAGGYGSVRGYDNSTLGPKYPGVEFQERMNIDPLRNKQDPSFEEVGGNGLVQFGTELALPVPFKGDWTRQVRPVIFAEGAQVFDTQCDVPNGNLTINGVDIDAKKYCKDNYGFDFGEMRYSVGVGFTWITMIGPLSLSYAFPLNDKPGDETKEIQFEIGRTF